MIHRTKSSDDNTRSNTAATDPNANCDNALKHYAVALFAIGFVQVLLGASVFLLPGRCALGAAVMVVSTGGLPVGIAMILVGIRKIKRQRREATKPK